MQVRHLQSPSALRSSRSFARARLGVAALLASASLAGTAGAKPFMEYLKPTPTVAPLSSATWGVAGVLPRDLSNGIESAKGAGVHPDYYYWDGQIIKAKDGKYHLFMSTFSGNTNFGTGWLNSDAYHAISQTNVLGPYVRQDFVYSNNGSHKGHNVSAVELPDGTLRGRRQRDRSLHDLQVEPLSTVRGRLANPRAESARSNISLIPRHDGKFEIVERNGTIAISDTLCGNYVKQKPTCAYTQNPTDAQGNPVVGSIYPKRTSIPGVSNPDLHSGKKIRTFGAAVASTTSSIRVPEIALAGTCIRPTASIGRTTGTPGLRAITRRSSVTREPPPVRNGTRWSARAWFCKMVTRRTSPGPWPMSTRTTESCPAPITAPRSSWCRSTA